MLGGEDGQVYQGCRFPADPGYAPQLAEYAAASAQVTRAAGRSRPPRGRLRMRASDEAGDWQVYALEMNLRKGGTTHPYADAPQSRPGPLRPDARARGSTTPTSRASTSRPTTSSILPGTACRPATVIAAIADAGLAFDYERGWGVVLHMLSCLAVDGRFGLTAIGTSPEHAQELYDAPVRR